MDTTEKTLDLLFRRIPPERLLKRVCDQTQNLSSPLTEQDGRKTFLDFADVTLHGYSWDEQSLFYDQLKQTVHKCAETLHTQESVFLPLVDFGQEVLTVHNFEPLCRSSRVLRWRDAYHLFGQDMIVCAYLAYHDIQRQVHREDFAWPAVLRSDDRILQQLLASSGIAENHFHLQGSTQVFALTWCMLMNIPDSISRLPDDFSSLLQSVASRGPEDNVLPLEDRLVVAALVRSILFRALHQNALTTPGISGRTAKETTFSYCRNTFLDEYIRYFSPINIVENRVRILQEEYGVWIPLPDGASVCLDYALELPIFQVVKDSSYRVLAGERYFLYRCFTACFSGRFSHFEQMLLYLYLSLKTAFRSEMIQVNRQVGFQNFSDYEKRKDPVWESFYQWEACRMALNAPLQTEPLRFLEARFTPAKTQKDLYQKVLKFDYGKYFADQPCRPLLSPQIHFDPERNAENFLQEQHFYVLHFPKRHDDTRLTAFTLDCRHQSLREETRVRAEALAKALSTSSYLCNRIRGIDACASELDCRPEVFAPAFRFLRGFQNTEPWRPYSMISHPTHHLSVSYHAGEDFYDIADGLRAIDEALFFLDYQRGDRIGHALALGVDPQTHYQTKSMNIILPKQNHLDNLVWLLYRGRELGVSVDPQQYGIMQQEALQLLWDIYGNVINKNNWSVTLQDYFCSMMLRGDEPGLYRTTKFRSPEGVYSNQYERWQISLSRSSEKLTAYRQSPKIAGMYYFYHYGQREKEEGRKPISISIKPGYITLIRQMQDALQWHLAARGIMIECNPSSNVLIGTFGEYANHPITRFNNIGLIQQSNIPCSQLHICVNTDDLGVFDTSLEFEYTLLYCMLNEQLDADGRPLYNSKNILNYLQNLQEMGLQAVFPKPECISCP